MIRLVWHLLGASMFIFSCYYDWFHVHLPEAIVFKFAGKLKYLTYWDAVSVNLSIFGRKCVCDIGFVVSDAASFIFRDLRVERLSGYK